MEIRRGIRATAARVAADGRSRGVRPGRRAFLARCEPLEPKQLLSGGIDPSFGSNGRAILPFNQSAGGNLFVSAMALQADGKIVVAGTLSGPSAGNLGTSSQFAVARLNADGSPDTSFGDQGESIVPISKDGNADMANASALAVQPDGRIVVAGSISTWNPSALSASEMAVVRLNTDGSPDTSFGDQGTGTALIAPPPSTSDPSSSLAAPSALSSDAVALLSDGSIVIAGSLFGGPGGRMAVAKLTADGRPTADFGTDGLILYGDPTGYGSASSLAVQPDGRIVVAGSLTAPMAPGGSAVILRINPDGSLDSSFAQGGRATVSYHQGDSESDFPRSVQVQPDGRVLVASQVSSYSFPADPGVNDSIAVAVARLNADGSADASFGTGGAVTYKGRDLTSLWNSGVNGMALQADGKIVLVGSAQSPDYFRSQFSALRLNADGSIDSDFGTGGMLGVSFDAVATDTPAAVAIQPDGNIVVAGLSMETGLNATGVGTPAPGSSPGGSLVPLVPGSGPAVAPTLGATPVVATPVLGSPFPGPIARVAVTRLLPSGTSPIADDTYSQPPPMPTYPPLGTPCDATANPTHAAPGSPPPTSPPATTTSTPAHTTSTPASAGSTSTPAATSASGKAPGSTLPPLQADAAKGSTVAAPTAPAPAPPTVLIAMKEGPARRTAALDVYFSSAMRPSDVLNPSFYSVSIPGRRRHPGHAVPVRSLSYDASRHMVHLVLRRPVPRLQPLTVSIRAGLADSTGSATFAGATEAAS